MWNVHLTVKKLDPAAIQSWEGGGLPRVCKCKECWLDNGVCVCRWYLSSQGWSLDGWKEEKVLWKAGFQKTLWCQCWLRAVSHGRELTTWSLCVSQRTTATLPTATTPTCHQSKIRPTALADVLVTSQASVTHVTRLLYCTVCWYPDSVGSVYIIVSFNCRAEYSDMIIFTCDRNDAVCQTVIQWM